MISKQITFQRVRLPKQIDIVVQLANTIWTEHYTPIIGKDQVTYMLNTYHSSHTISNEVKTKSIHYYLILQDTMPVGYVGIRLDEKSLFLSKIYVLSQIRGHGLGTQTIEFIKELASSNQLEKIMLTVNKNNSSSIAAYQKMGFKITDELCADIGKVMSWMTI